MKKLKSLFALTLLCAFSAGAQTFNAVPTNVIVMPMPTPSISGGLGQIAAAIKAADIGHMSNYLIAPYATYAPKAPTKYGGGIMAIYNVNSHLGMAAGLDWLGQFTLVSGNATLKADTHPLRSFSSSTNSFFYNFTATPFALAGAGVDVGGTGSHVIWDLGLHTSFGHFMGGKFGLGGAYGEWIGSSPYDVKRYHFFVDWQKGF